MILVQGYKDKLMKYNREARNRPTLSSHMIYDKGGTGGQCVE